MAPGLRLNTTLEFDVPSPQRQLLWAVIRRTQAAILEYTEGREALDEYLSQLPALRLRPYYTALRHFEVCLGLTYQACQYALHVLDGPTRLFTPGDNSDFERLNVLYNAWKHGDKAILRGEYAPESTLLVWITNEGLESRGAALGFSELREILNTLPRLLQPVVRVDPTLAARPAPETP